MYKMIAIFISLITVSCFANSQAPLKSGEQNQLSPIEIFILRSGGSFNSYNIPEGYEVKLVETFSPNQNLLSFIALRTEEKMTAWYEFVMEGSEYDHLNLEERLLLAKNPLQEFESLLSIIEVYEISLDGRVIGFHVEIDDYVQAAIYQDGAWIELFLDTDQLVVKESNESA